ncbi:MAG: RHS repeat-associated core domain-containing protein [Acidobacteriota bacterium]
MWLVHMNGRVYDQNLGRFLSVDPIVQGSGSQSLNPYSYLNNNPLSGTDPSGYAGVTGLACDSTESSECGSSASNNPVGTEIVAVRAATMTGSHIAGNSGSQNISVTLVNPTEKGMAELSVAMSGHSSGFTVQSSSTEKTSGSVAADQGKAGSQAPRSQDRPGKSEQADHAVGGPPLLAMLAISVLSATSSNDILLPKSAANPSNGFLTPDEAKMAFYQENDAKYLAMNSKELWGLAVESAGRYFFTNATVLAEVPLGRGLAATGFPNGSKTVGVMHTHPYVQGIDLEKLSMKDAGMSVNIPLSVRTPSGGFQELFKPKKGGAQLGRSLCPGGADSCFTPSPNYCRGTGKCVN